MRKIVAFAHRSPKHSGAVVGSMLSASSRVLQLGVELQALKEATGGILENLWPNAPVPGTLHDLSVRLDRAPAGIDEQMEMAARGGTDMALSLVVSWYPSIDLNMLTALEANGLQPPSPWLGVLEVFRVCGAGLAPAQPPGVMVVSRQMP